MSKEVKKIQLDYATDDDHKQNNSVPGVPMVLTHIANSCVGQTKSNEQQFFLN